MLLSNENHIEAISGLVNDEVKLISEAIFESIKQGNKVLICGNGGSASDSNHIAAEFVGRFEKNRKPFNSISLSSNIALITAIANDFGFKYIFSRQIEAIGNQGDVLIALSTSGKSKNIIEAIKMSLNKGIKVIFITGNHKLSINKKNILLLKIKSKNTATIQEAYMYLLHNIVRNIENEFTF
jgi:D-sedoheptulose 7-phosphate isomerase